MCVGFPAEIISINGGSAVIDYLGVRKEVNIMLLPAVQVGDYVLVHAGIALQKISPSEASELFELFKELQTAAESPLKDQAK